MISILTNKIEFPDPRTADSEGFLAVGGDLSVERLRLAYSLGIFPWFPYRENCLQWYCPHERFVIFPSEIHISHSMRTLINSGQYEASFDENFEDVIKCCSKVDNRDEEYGAWLGPQMIKAYTKLHKLGLAMSVEVWQNDLLVGGLYGVKVGKCFCGESMFSFAPSASKFALISLAQKMQQEGGVMIDCQFETPHLLTMGGRTISYDEYMNYLRM